MSTSEPSSPSSPAVPAARERLEERVQAFRARLERQRAKAPLRRARFVTDAEQELRDVYTPLDLAGGLAGGLPGGPTGGDGDLDRIGLPGEYPFTRGVRPAMYRERLWTMRQYAGFGSAEASSRRFRYLIEKGQTGLSVAFDLPTQLGRDPDHDLSRGEVGRGGVSVATLDDMRALLDGLPLERVSTSMTINATAATLLALYVAVADERGVPRGRIAGTVQNDVLKEYIARGTYIYPPRPSLRLVTDVFRFCSAELPRWNTISISGYHIREAGSDAVQEVAFTLASGIAYVEAALTAGLPLDQFAPRLSFFFSAHNNLLEEVAKFRAARRLWARTLRERFGATDDKSCMLRFHAQTAGSMLTAQQPLVNVVRATVQALGAVLGGCQSLHVSGYDEALALPTEQSALLALRTQQILAHESGVADIVDPLGGSYALEALTDQIEAAAADALRRIDALGGMVAAIEQYHPQRQIEQRAYEYQRSVETGQRVVVGVNDFVIKEDRPLGLHRPDPAGEARRVEQVRAFRRQRDNQGTAEALRALTKAASTPSRGDNNLVAAILHAVKAGATVGEVADALRTVFGEHRG